VDAASPAVWGGVLTLVALAAALVVAWRRRDTAALLLAGLVAFEIVVAIVAVSRISGPIEPYLVDWVSALGMLSWIALGAACLAMVRDGRAVRVLAVGAAAALVAAAVVATSYAGYDRGPTDAQQVAAIARRIARDTPRGEPVVLRIGDDPTWPVVAATLLELRRRGVDARVEQRRIDVLFDPWDTTTAAGSRPTATFVLDGQGATERVPGARDLGTVLGSRVLLSSRL
jgi:hypothetical protein